MPCIVRSVLCTFRFCTVVSKQPAAKSLVRIYLYLLRPFADALQRQTGQMQ